MLINDQKLIIDINFRQVLGVFRVGGDVFVVRGQLRVAPRLLLLPGRPRQGPLRRDGTLQVGKKTHRGSSSTW